MRILLSPSGGVRIDHFCQFLPNFAFFFRYFNAKNVPRGVRLHLSPPLIYVPGRVCRFHYKNLQTKDTQCVSKLFSFKIRRVVKPYVQNTSVYKSSTRLSRCSVDQADNENFLTCINIQIQTLKFYYRLTPASSLFI